MSKKLTTVWLAFVLALFICAIFSCRAGAQAIDEKINPSGPVFKFVQGRAWGSSGPGGLGNNFIFTPISQSENVCVYVFNNNPTNSHVTTVTIGITGDPSIAFQGASNTRWLQSVPQGVTTVGTNGVAVFQGSAAGAAQVVLIISADSAAGGSPDTADVVLSQIAGNQTCGAGSGTVAKIVNSGPPSQTTLVGGLSSLGRDASTSNFYCPFTKFVNNPGIGSTLVVTGLAGLTIRVCSFHWSQTPASTFKLNEGTTATCGTGPADVTGTEPTTATGRDYTVGPGAPLILAVPGDNLCVTLGTASTTGTVEVHYGLF